jgi:hypothetical protein
MGRYLQSAEWYAKRDRAFVIWRCIGWGLCAGLLVARVEASHLSGLVAFLGGTHLYGWLNLLLVIVAQGLAAVLLVALTAPAQLLAVFSLAYAASIRLVAASLHYRMKRVGHHLGYTHVDTKNEVYTERWYEIVPVTERVNKMEWRLRGGKPSPGFGRYLRRTVIAIGIVRFWWMGVAFAAAWYWFGWSPVVAWLGVVGHRV